MALERELQYFESQRENLLTHYRGQFAVIKGEELLGTFTTFDEAFSAGVRAYGTESFLIKEVTDEEGLVQHPALTVGMISARL